MCAKPNPPPKGPKAAFLRALGAWRGQAAAAPGAAEEPPPGPAPVTKERRADVRTPLDRGALLELPGQRRMAVILLDLSEGGAGVQMRSTAPAVGVTGRLIVDTAVLPARVSRVEAGRVGLVFPERTPQTAETVRRIIAATGLADAA